MVLKSCRDFHIDCAVLHSNKSCVPSTMGQMDMKQALEEELDIPFVALPHPLPLRGEALSLQYALFFSFGCFEINKDWRCPGALIGRRQAVVKIGRSGKGRCDAVLYAVLFPSPT